jgi:hypothetical protein
MKAAQRYMQHIADSCRNAYIAERTAFEISKNRLLADRKPPYKYSPPIRFDGGEDSDGKTFSPVWPKIAQFMVRHGLDPRTCIRKRFEKSMGYNPPWPNQIAVASYLDLYRGISEVLTEEEVALGFRLDKEYCRIAATDGRYDRKDKSSEWKWKAILLDFTLSISPLMRYCLAKELKLESVAAQLEMRAVSQYVKAPNAYNKVWGKAITDELRQYSTEILRLASQKTKNGQV